MLKNLKEAGFIVGEGVATPSGASRSNWGRRLRIEDTLGDVHAVQASSGLATYSRCTDRLDLRTRSTGLSSPNGEGTCFFQCRASAALTYVVCIYIFVISHLYIDISIYIYTYIYHILYHTEIYPVPERAQVSGTKQDDDPTADASAPALPTATTTLPPPASSSLSLPRASTAATRI